jgi:hypothetical protein
LNGSNAAPLEYWKVAAEDNTFGGRERRRLVLCRGDEEVNSETQRSSVEKIGIEEEAVTDSFSVVASVRPTSLHKDEKRDATPSSNSNSNSYSNSNSKRNSNSNINVPTHARQLSASLPGQQGEEEEEALM